MMPDATPRDPGYPRDGAELQARLERAAAEGLEPNIRRFMRFRGPSYPCELQALSIAETRFESNRAAHARTEDEAVTLAGQAEAFHALGVFVLFNAVDPAVATRAQPGKWNTSKKGGSTTDADVRARTLLFIDVDAKRPRGTSSSAEELSRTFPVACDVARHFPPASVGYGYSGNGAAVFVALDTLPETPSLGALVRRVLAALAARHLADGVEIDVTVCDAKRLCPAFGTTKRKGARGIAERPHRRTAFLGPSAPHRLTLSDLEHVAGELAPPEPPAAPASTPAPRRADADDVWATARAVPVGAVLEWLDLGTEERPTCPGCRESDGSAVSVVGNGLKCLHKRCATRGVPGHDGFRTTVDLVCEARGVAPGAALRALGERFGFSVPGRAPEARTAPPRLRVVPPVEAADEGRDAPGPDDDWRSRILQNGAGQIIKSSSNATIILGHDPAWQGVIAFDDFAQAIVTTRAAPWDAADAPLVTRAGPWTDTDTTRAQSWILRHYSLKLEPAAVWSAVSVVADRLHVHPVRRYLESLRWDGQRRLPTWLTVYLGAPEKRYHDRVGQWFLVGAVARIMRPGCKVDTMPVLEGQQGARKSSALRTLFGAEWFSDTPLDLSSKDRFCDLAGKWCVELAELDSLRGHEVERVKGFLSSQSDSYRPPYGRATVVAPRQVVFCGSTNRDDYLRDETGNRRFWPVVTGRIDLGGLERDRDQLWAEAREAYEGGAAWWPSPEDAALCREEQAARMHIDAWTPCVAEFLRTSAGARTTVGDVLTRIGIERAKWTQSDQNRVARILAQLGWSRVRRRGTDGLRSWGYEPVSPVGPTHQDTTGDGEAQ